MINIRKKFQGAKRAFSRETLPSVEISEAFFPADFHVVILFFTIHSQ